MTRRQAELLNFLNDWFARDSVAPSFREIAAGTGTKSLSSVNRLLRALVDQGVVRMAAGRARRVEVVGSRLSSAELAWCERNIAHLRVAMAEEQDGAGDAGAGSAHRGVTP